LLVDKFSTHLDLDSLIPLQVSSSTCWNSFTESRFACLIFVWR
jgi:hypothetical protein